MLLAYEIPEKKLKWFRNKGILIKKCKPVVKENKHPKLVILCKFYMFALEFKKWENIIYLDADIIVRASLDRLININGFGAVLDDLIMNRLIDQFIFPSQMSKKTFNQIKKKYDIKNKAFNAGIMAFKTDIIKEDTCLRLKSLAKSYKGLHKSAIGDQLILNLFFYNKWKELPIIYNLDMRDFKFINPKKINAIILHFIGEDKPWLLNSHFHNEWKSNLKRADKINLDKIPFPSKKFKQSEIKNYSLYLKIRSLFYIPNWMHFIDYQIGLMGIFLYDKFPKLYFKLKRFKNEI